MEGRVAKGSVADQSGAVSWVLDRAADSGNAVYAHSHTAALRGRHGNMENRLLVPPGALRIRGNGTRVLAAHADNGLLLGYGAVGLEKKDGVGVGGGEADICPVQGAGWLGLGREIGAQSVAKGRLRI